MLVKFTLGLGVLASADSGTENMAEKIAHRFGSTFLIQQNFDW